MRLDMYDDFPSGMRSYLKAYGWHFSKAMCDWAVSMMEKEDGNGKKVKITPFTKEQVDEFKSYVSVDDEETLTKVFEIFKDKFKNEFDFVD